MTARGATTPLAKGTVMPDDEIEDVRAWAAGFNTGEAAEPAALSGAILAVYAVVAYVLGRETTWFDAELDALVAVALSALLALRVRSVVTPIRGLFSRQ